MRSRIVCYFFAFLCTFIIFNRNQISQVFYVYDKAGYYVYLPAVFVYDDLDSMKFVPSVAAGYGMPGDPYFALHEVMNGKRVNKYPVGVSLFELPGFLLAHFYCTFVTAVHPADGYSDPYEWALIFTTILWSFGGLLVLRRFLLRHFNDNIVAIVLACIGLGTNFFIYASFDPGMSHNFSFFLFSCLLLYTDKAYAERKKKYMILIGLILGFITITRPINIVAVILPVLWGISDMETLRDQIKNIFRNYRTLILSSICFLAVCFIQFSYWKYTSGRWLYYSYKGEGFSFANPQIWKGLFSARKGWFVYTPIAFIAFTGLFVSPKKYLPSILVFFAVIIYCVFSWRLWYYGGSFGCRPLIDTLPVLAMPLAFLTRYILAMGKIAIKATYLLVLGLLVLLNLFQSYQFVRDVIHYDRMTAKYYWRVFGKLQVTEEDKKYLMNEDLYFEEIRKISKTE